MTLNMLGNFRTNPKLSAYAAIFGIHDFNRCPLAPPGTKVIVHERTGIRRYWSPHGTYGWYIGLSMEHYIYLQFSMPTTYSVRNMDTLTFFPASIPFPKMETEDYLWQSVRDILVILSKPKNQTLVINLWGHYNKLGGIHC